MPSSRSSSTRLKVMKTVRATAKAASAKWADLAPAKSKAKAKAAELTSAVQKSSGQKRPRSASDSSEGEVAATFTKKKRSTLEIDEVVTEPEIVDAEEDGEGVVIDLSDKGDEDGEEEAVSLGFMLNVGMILTAC